MVVLKTLMTTAILIY